MSVKVIQVCYVYPPSFSGYGKQLETVNSHFKNDKDIEYEVITAYAGNSEMNVFSFYNHPRKTIANEKYDYYLFVLLSPFKYIKKLVNADVIHIVKAGPEILIWALLGKILGKKIVIKIAQDEVENYHMQSFFRKIRYNFLKLADTVIALSSKIESELIEIGLNDRSIQRINNSYKPHELSAANELLDDISLNHKDKYIISFVGSLCKRKGVQDLLCALSRYKGTREILLLMVGPNYKDIDNLDDLIDEVNSTGNCSVLTLGKRKDAKLIISISDLLVLPSYSEGMPNVVIEALCNGVPVLASDIPVIHDMLDVSNGAIFKLGDPIDLLGKLEYLISTDFIKQDIKDSACKNYSVSNIGQTYKKLYLKLGKSNAI